MTEQKSDDLRRGALYIRVSTHDQDELPQMRRSVCSWTMLRITESLFKRMLYMESVSSRNVKKRIPDFHTPS